MAEDAGKTRNRRLWIVCEAFPTVILLLTRNIAWPNPTYGHKEEGSTSEAKSKANKLTSQTLATTSRRTYAGPSFQGAVGRRKRDDGTVGGRNLRASWKRSIFGSISRLGQCDGI